MHEKCAVKFPVKLKSPATRFSLLKIRINPSIRSTLMHPPCERRFSECGCVSFVSRFTLQTYSITPFPSVSMIVLARWSQRSQALCPVLGIVKASITLGHVVIYSWCVRGAGKFVNSRFLCSALLAAYRYFSTLPPLLRLFSIFTQSTGDRFSFLFSLYFVFFRVSRRRVQNLYATILILRCAREVYIHSRDFIFIFVSKIFQF